MESSATPGFTESPETKDLEVASSLYPYYFTKGDKRLLFADYSSFLSILQSSIDAEDFHDQRDVTSSAEDNVIAGPSPNQQCNMERGHHAGPRSKSRI